MLNVDLDDLPKFSQEEEQNDADIVENNDGSNPDEDDIDPPLDEEDLEENGLSVEEADKIEWEAPKSGSAGDEEKDIAV